MNISEIRSNIKRTKKKCDELLDGIGAILALCFIVLLAFYAGAWIVILTEDFLERSPIFACDKYQDRAIKRLLFCERRQRSQNVDIVAISELGAFTVRFDDSGFSCWEEREVKVSGFHGGSSKIVDEIVCPNEYVLVKRP